MTEHDTTGPQPKPDDLPGSPHFEGSADGAGPAAREDCAYAGRVSAYHDGEVSELEARDVAQHVAECPACAAQLAFFGRVSSTFDSAPAPRLGPDARQRLLALAHPFGADASDRPRIMPSADVRWVRRLAAVAAILFVIAASRVIYEQRLASHGGGAATPAINLHEPVAPLPQPADFVVGRSIPSTGSTTSPQAGSGQTSKPPTTASTQKQ